MFWKTKNDPQSGFSQRSHNCAPSVIAQDISIIGNIVSEGLVDFAGTIDGNIRCQTLTVRPGGVVNGEVTANTVLVYGKVKGLVRAKHVHLYDTSHIEGIVMHESLTIEDGAFIDGKCKRTDKPLPEKAEPAPMDDLMKRFTSPEEPQHEPEVRVLKNIRLISA
jgi:cytoskeletal protein CcmA (bactofilin family)